jgi:hypothetical protein
MKCVDNLLHEASECAGTLTVKTEIKGHWPNAKI